MMWTIPGTVLQIKREDSAAPLTAGSARRTGSIPTWAVYLWGRHCAEPGVFHHRSGSLYGAELGEAGISHGAGGKALFSAAAVSDSEYQYAPGKYAH